MAQGSSLPSRFAIDEGLEAVDTGNYSKSLLSKHLISSDRIGVGNQIERRKRQNRLRQSAWRRRRNATRESQSVASIDDVHWKGYGLLMIKSQQNSETAAAGSVATSFVEARQKYTKSQLSMPEGTYRNKSNRHKLIPPLLLYASHNTTTQFSSSMSFPLSADHCLITLVQYNVVRAMLFNMSILAMMDCLPLGCGLSLRIPQVGHISPNMIPPDLQPSRIQDSMPHSFWINAIPFPKVRDNLILMSGQYDSDELFYDLGQGLYEGFDSVERYGYLVWGDAWSAQGWEVSEGFVKKWGFLLAGCEDVIESTNRWREIRGEGKLIVEV